MNTRKSQSNKLILKGQIDRLAQSCSSIPDAIKKIKTKEIVGIPTPRKLRHSTSQRVKGVILALKQKSTSSFIGDDQSICLSAVLISQYNRSYSVQMGQI